MANPIDVCQFVIEKCVAEDIVKSQDLRLSLCLIIKVVFFVIFLAVGGRDKYDGGEYALTLFVWLIFHIYIFCFEGRYIFSGENYIQYRATWFKIFDNVQMGILLIYFLTKAYGNGGGDGFSIFMTYDLTTDIVLNFDQLIRYRREYSPRTPSNQVQGGKATFYFAMMVGGVIAIYVVSQLIDYANHTNYPTFPFYTPLLICAIIGEVAFLLLCFILLIACIREENSFFATYWQKTLLMFCYGVSVGIFNIYYAIITGVAIVIRFLIWIYQQFQNRGREAVSPQ